MERRNFLVALLGVPALGLLAACGSDTGSETSETSDTVAEPPPEASIAPATDPVVAPIETEAPEVSPSNDPLPLLSYTTPGGFTTREYAFQDPPIVLLTQDGSLIGLSVSSDVFTGPFPKHETRVVSPAGIEKLVAAAGSAGLLADVDYTSNDVLLVADAATATLTISADGTTYTHEAYALGVGAGPGAAGTESTPERQALLDFLTALQDNPASIFGADNLGASTDYEPASIQLVALPLDDLSGFDPVPTVQPWPVESGIELATSSECVETDSATVREMVSAASQLTFFSENGVTYQVTARPAYPGRSC